MLRGEENRHRSLASPGLLGIRCTQVRDRRRPSGRCAAPNRMYGAGWMAANDSERAVRFPRDNSRDNAGEIDFDRTPFHRHRIKGSRVFRDKQRRETRCIVSAHADGRRESHSSETIAPGILGEVAEGVARIIMHAAMAPAPPGLAGRRGAATSKQRVRQCARRL
jgi:hypothetical protein